MIVVVIVEIVVVVVIVILLVTVLIVVIVVTMVVIAHLPKYMVVKGNSQAIRALLPANKLPQPPVPSRLTRTI